MYGQTLVRRTSLDTILLHSKFPNPSFYHCPMVFDGVFHQQLKGGSIGRTINPSDRVEHYLLSHKRLHSSINHYLIVSDNVRLRRSPADKTARVRLGLVQCSVRLCPTEKIFLCKPQLCVSANDLIRHLVTQC